MRDARRFSAREVSQGVQRPVLAQTTWFGSTVVAHSGAAPLVFEPFSAKSCPADRPRWSLDSEDVPDVTRAQATVVTAGAVRLVFHVRRPCWAGETLPATRSTRIPG